MPGLSRSKKAGCSLLESRVAWVQEGIYPHILTQIPFHPGIGSKKGQPVLETDLWSAERLHGFLVDIMGKEMTDRRTLTLFLQDTLIPFF